MVRGAVSWPRLQAVYEVRRTNSGALPAAQGCGRVLPEGARLEHGEHLSIVSTGLQRARGFLMARFKLPVIYDEASRQRNTVIAASEVGITNGLIRENNLTLIHITEPTTLTR